MRTKFQVLLHISVVAAMLLAALGIVPAGAMIVSPAASNTQVAVSSKAVKPEVKQLEAAEPAEVLSNEPAIYMIRLADPALAAYAGGINGLAATSPQVTGARKLNVNSAVSKAYANYLAGKRAQAIAAVNKALERSINVVYEYYTANNGFATYLTPAEAEVVAKLPGVIYIERDAKSQLQTDVGPTWMGANTIWNGTATGVATKGEGVIVGVIDTGINHLSPSFADIGGDGYNHTNPFGAGIYKGYCVANPSFCNDKLIGAWNYPVLSSTPEDADGHGSHTASTAAGNVVTAVLTSTSGAVFTRTISGVAPHANVIMYAACCDNSALAAAIDQTVIDGVDAVNFSIGSTGGSDPWTLFDSVGFLNARNAGIFVANSAGNNGPGFATLGSPAGAPWLTAVAASSHNRQFLSSVISATGGLITNTPPALNGRGMSNGIGLTPIVYAGAAPYNDPLCQISTADGTFTGKIVVCDRGVNGRVEKGQNVAARGAVGMIMVEVGPDGPGYFTTDSEQPVPAVYLTRGDGDLLKAWLTTGSGHQVAISPTVMDINAAYGDIMASFSSRGQNTSLADIIAPSVTAPGVAIFAAYKTPENFAVIQGTSMSSPHVAGAGALMIALHPTWTPAEIQSALMTTARTSVLKEDGVTPADPFDMGSGHVDLSKAAGASFVLNETYANYVAANPATGGDVKKLNLASFGNANCVKQCSWIRTLTSVLTGTATYTASVTAPAGLTVTVTPANFTLGAGASRVITMSVDTGNSAFGVWQFATVSLDGGPSIPAAHFPVAVKPSSGSLPAKIDITTPRDSGSQDFSVTSLEVTTLTHRIDGLVPAIRYTGVLTGDSSNGSWFDNLADGVQVFTVTMTTNDVRLTGGDIATTAHDMDLYLYKDTNGNGHPDAGDLLVNYSASSAAIEHVDVITSTGGMYFFILQNWAAGPTPPDQYTFEIAKVSKTDAGNTGLLGPTSAAGGTPYTLTLTYNEPAMNAGDNWYGLITLGTDPGNPGNIGQVPVDVHRIADEVSKSVSASTANVGDVLTYTIVIKNPDPVTHNYVLTDVLPTGVTYVSGTVTGPATYNVGSNAILVSTTVNGLVASASYAFEDSIANPSLAGSSPFGGYLDLAGPPYLFTVNNFGDDVSGNFNTLGCNFNFYDTALGSPTRIGFSSNGLFFPRGTQISAGGGTASPISTTIPSVITPNGFIAGFWDDLVASSIVAGVIITPSGYVAATSGSCPNRAGVLQIVNAWRFDDPTQVLNYELQFDSATPDEYWILYGNISGTLTTGSVGIEAPSGTAGLQYLYGTTPSARQITSGRVIRYYRPLVAAPPITVTFQVTVEAGAPLIVVNTADYTVNVPNTVVMGSSASFSVNTAPSSVAITGPSSGVVNTSYSYVATVTPATQPITYTWQATGQSDVVHTGGGVSDTVAFNWAVAGTKTITVTADNGYGTQTSTKQVTISVPPFSVTINGPTHGAVNNSYSFTAPISPISTTQPITYTWQATGQSTVIHTGGGASDMVSFSWPVTGTKTITVTANNGYGSVIDTLQIIIDLNKFYLPIVRK